jgi:hypothetical protein
MNLDALADEGALQGGGEFTVDRARALRTLQRHQLGGWKDWIRLVIAALVQGGVDEACLDCSSSRIRLSCRTGEFDPNSLANPALSPLGGTPEEKLLLGLSLAARSALSVRWYSGERYWCAAKDRLVNKRAMPGWVDTAHTRALEICFGHSGAVGRLLGRPLAGFQLGREFRFAPLKLTLNGSPVEPSWPFDVQLGAEGRCTLVEGYWGEPEGFKFEPGPLSGYANEGPLTVWNPESRGRTLVAFQQPERGQRLGNVIKLSCINVAMAFAQKYYRSALSGVIYPVRFGVMLPPIHYQNLVFPYARCVASANHLKVDLSSRRLIRDEAYEEWIQELRSKVKLLASSVLENDRHLEAFLDRNLAMSVRAMNLFRNTKAYAKNLRSMLDFALADQAQPPEGSADLA